jgi:hypothetical protein
MRTKFENADKAYNYFYDKIVKIHHVHTLYSLQLLIMY